jgi:hypothetical protein
MSLNFTNPGEVTGDRRDATQPDPVTSFFTRIHLAAAEIRALFRARQYVTLSGTVAAYGSQNTDAFFADLNAITRKTGNITHAFLDPQSAPVGYVDLHRAGGTVTIHRIWSVFPRRGHGSKMLRQICELADRHHVFIKLKIAPLGRKPYPMSSEQLREWYCRYGFKGEKHLIRAPS